jgi:hypothetical protein
MHNYVIALDPTPQRGAASYGGGKAHNGETCSMMWCWKLQTSNVKLLDIHALGYYNVMLLYRTSNGGSVSGTPPTTNSFIIHAAISSITGFRSFAGGRAGGLAVIGALVLGCAGRCGAAIVDGGFCSLFVDKALSAPLRLDVAKGDG